MDGVYFIFQKKNSVGFVIQIRQKCPDGFFYALEACLVNLELPEKLFICLDVLVKLWSSRSVFGDFFVSSESLSYPHGTARKFEDMK